MKRIGLYISFNFLVEYKLCHNNYILWNTYIFLEQVEYVFLEVTRGTIVPT
jgi:hypothetical protein